MSHQRSVENDPSTSVSATEASPSAAETTSAPDTTQGPRWLADSLAKLRDEVAEANAISRERERIIDRLHEENKRLRAEALDRLAEPLLRDLIRLSDDLGKTVAAYSAKDSTPPAILADLRSYADAVQDILYRQGVEPFDAAQGTPFDPKTHRALATVPAGEGDRDRTIARVIRVGFASGARVLRLLEAEVYRARSDTSDAKPGLGGLSEKG
jgi:molecular chaperone GrpE